MPELPEIESLAHMLGPHIEGAVVEAARFFRGDLRWIIPVQKFAADFVGRRVERVFRRSKYLLWQTDKTYGLFHLGMSGNMLLMDRSEPVQKHTHAIFTVASSEHATRKYVHFVDPRRFGVIDCFDVSAWNRQKYLRDLGVEPLENAKLGSYLFNASRRKAQPVKNFLMDAKVVVGVGNIYASEALFRAGIRPHRQAGKIDLISFQRLAREIRGTLRKAIRAGGTSFRDYRNADGAAGENSINLMVYDRKGEPCRRCGKAVIKTLRLAGRSSYYCPKCQL